MQGGPRAVSHGDDTKALQMRYLSKDLKTVQEHLKVLAKQRVQEVRASEGGGCQPKGQEEGQQGSEQAGIKTD